MGNHEEQDRWAGDILHCRVSQLIPICSNTRVVLLRSNESPAYFCNHFPEHGYLAFVPSLDQSHGRKTNINLTK